MSQNNETGGTSRAAAIAGMIVTFLGGYVLGSMSARTPSTVKDPAKVRRKVVDVGNSPVQGPDDALVTIVEFADFQCPYCARSLPVRRRLFQEYGTKVRWVFKNLPLKFHQHARMAALAALAAREQGKFWEYHDRLFMNQDKLEEADLVEHARVLGLDVKQFREALTRKKFEPEVDADVEMAKALKVQGTPNYFINGRHFMGSLSYRRMEEAVREEIAYAQKLMRDGIPRQQLYEELTREKSKQPASGTDEDKQPNAATPPAKQPVAKHP